MRRSVARWNAAFMRQKGCLKKFVLRPFSTRVGFFLVAISSGRLSSSYHEKANSYPQAARPAVRRPELQRQARAREQAAGKPSISRPAHLRFLCVEETPTLRAASLRAHLFQAAEGGLQAAENL